MDKKLQQFHSRCLREIIYPTYIETEQQDKNEDMRRKHCVPTIYSQIQTEKQETYIDGKRHLRQHT